MMRRYGILGLCAALVLMGAPAGAKNIGDSLMVIVTDENGDPVVGGGGGGGGPVSVADGDDATQGAIADDPATPGSTGTISAKLRLATTLLDAIKSAVESGATAANQATLNGYVDGLEALLTTIDADTGTIAGAVKAEDAAHSSGHTGIPFWGVRNDAGASALSDTNGDYTPVAVDSTGKLFISTLNTISGAVVPGTSATHLGKAEDAAHVSGDTGVMMLGVRSASPTDRSAGPTDGDYEPPGINDVGAMWTTPTGSANGGAATSYTASTASTNATQVKASPGTVYSIVAVNTTATIYYLRLYNLAAAPTCSSATGFVATIPVPASASGAGIQIPLLVGQAYSTGIGFCLTGGAGSTDNTNAATGVYVTIIYK